MLAYWFVFVSTADQAEKKMGQEVGRVRVTRSKRLLPFWLGLFRPKEWVSFFHLVTVIATRVQFAYLINMNTLVS